MRRLLCAFALMLLAGCALYHEKQVDMFVDEEGRSLIVHFGELSRSYTYEVVSPVNGVSLESKDNRVVKLNLPDDLDIDRSYSKSITCRICQSIAMKGTMYLSTDKEWLFWTIGTMSRVYLFDEELNDYVCVFQGELDVPPGQRSL